MNCSFPPVAPPPGASAWEIERYRKALSQYEKDDKLTGRLGWGIAGFMVVVFGSLFIILAYDHQVLAPERMERHRQEVVARNRAAISSCINRGGYVIENSRGRIKECRGVQRAP